MRSWAAVAPLVLGLAACLDYPTRFKQPAKLSLGIKQFAGGQPWTQEIWIDEILVSQRYVPCGE